jgi:hypothetical protein
MEQVRVGQRVGHQQVVDKRRQPRRAPSDAEQRRVKG